MKWPWIVAAIGWVVALAMLVLWLSSRPRFPSVAPLRATFTPQPEEQLRGMRRSAMELLAVINHLPEPARREGIARLGGREAEVVQALLSQGEVTEGDLAGVAAAMGLEERPFLQMAYRGLARALPEFRADTLEQAYFLNYSERRGDVALRWLTLESYRGGFILTSHGEVTGKESGPDGHLDLGRISVEDDLGQRYYYRGGQVPREHHFAPALDPRARQLRITLPSVRWVVREGPPRSPRPSETWRPEFTEESLLDQPWVFVFSLEVSPGGIGSPR